MSKVEFGIRRSDFTPLAFKTIRDDKVAKKELRNLKMVKDVPHVIQILDYFYDDNGHTVLVLPVLKKFEFHKMDFLQLAKYSQQLIKVITFTLKPIGVLSSNKINHSSFQNPLIKPVTNLEFYRQLMAYILKV
jgi:pyruvate-formate lyase-activating enzyme